MLLLYYYLNISYLWFNIFKLSFHNFELTIVKNNIVLLNILHIIDKYMPTFYTLWPMQFFNDSTNHF